MLPDMTLYVGLHADPVLLGPGVATWDFDDWALARLTCAALGLEKTTDDPDEAEVVNDGADLRVHILEADLAGFAPGTYPYMLRVQGADGEWRPVAGKGTISLQAPV